MTIHKYNKSCIDLCIFSPRNTKKIKRHAGKLSTLLFEATLREYTVNYLAISFSLFLLFFVLALLNSAESKQNFRARIRTYVFHFQSLKNNLL